MGQEQVINIKIYTSKIIPILSRNISYIIKFIYNIAYQTLSLYSYLSSNKTKIVLILLFLYNSQKLLNNARIGFTGAGADGVAT